MDYKELKEVCKINMGQSPDSSSYNYKEDGLPFYQGNADFGERYPITRVWCNAPNKIAQPGDILISVRAPIGALNYTKEECCIGRGLAAITPNKSKVSSEFVYWFLKEKNAELNSKGTGSTFKAINRKILEETMIPDLDFEKQHEYAQILEKTYDVIQQRKHELEQFDELIRSRFVEMFGDPKYNTQKWPMYLLGSLFMIGSSKRIYQSDQVREGIPFLRISDLMNRIEKGDETAELFITEELYEKLKENNLVPVAGDLLVTSRGTLGQCYEIQKQDKFYFQDGMISWLYNRDEKITNTYLVYLFRMPGFRLQIDKVLAGSTVNYLSLDRMKNLRIMCPPVELQQQFAAFVAQVDKSKVAVQKIFKISHFNGII